MPLHSASRLWRVDTATSLAESSLAVMCGIVGIVPHAGVPAAPDITKIRDLITAARAVADGLGAEADASPAVLDGLGEVARSLGAAADATRGAAGVLAVAADPDLHDDAAAALDAIVATVDGLDSSWADSVSVGTDGIGADALAALGAVRDAAWSLRTDRLGAAKAALALAGGACSPTAAVGWAAIQRSLDAIDRLEVRGRDSAGIHVSATVDAAAAGDLGHLAGRSDPLFTDTAVDVNHVDAEQLMVSFTYKAAAEIGELGDNTRSLRASIAADTALRRLLSLEGARVIVLGHTRWASVGVISEPNTHPLNSTETEVASTGPYAIASLNGDVDNHGDLRVDHALAIHDKITTDAKVIPVMWSRRLADGLDPAEAFRRTVMTFEGSVAVCGQCVVDPDLVMLALAGSGQGLYVGLAPDAYVIASEPYGVVADAAEYVRMDGESGGEIMALDARVGGRAGISRRAYDGTEQPIDDVDIAIAEVTTRDIDLGDAPHYLLKEISEAPESMHKTLRGRIVDIDGRRVAHLGETGVPSAVRERLANGSISRVRVIGQGTAAVAGQSTAAIIDTLTGGGLDAVAITATELSGFGLRPDMSDTLVIAVSQSGTTTDTNRTVDLLRSRGAAVIAIVNRRGSDLTERADGVVYTSDGRDVEMSVASTKAFYAQVAAGALLACEVVSATGLGDEVRRHRLLSSLADLPAAMREVLAERPAIAEAAHRLAPSKRYWAVVGNGPNRVAANEVRIKLSELCYKSIASDITEDKKHIDLSSEPLILVCAAGLSGSTADDVAKETAIFSAHKATAVVVADRGETRFTAAAVIGVPSVDPALGFVLSAMVGHLFGYEAARAIDASAMPLRRAREAIEHAAADLGDGDAVIARLRTDLDGPARDLAAGLRSGLYDGHLEASTAVRMMSLLADVASDRPIERYTAATGKVGTPTLLIEDLLAALTAGIDELTRPIDAIKHQAKTVTVGISRSDSDLLDVALVGEVLTAGAGRDVLAYRTLKVLAALDAAVDEVVGFTRYGIEAATLAVVDRGGLSRNLTSRADGDPVLRGTKRYVAENREVLVARGRGDGRIVILVPEVKGVTCTGLTLLHVRLRDRLSVADARRCLQGYDNRYDRLVDWVSETEGSFDDERLADIDVAELLIAPISETADHWVAGAGGRAS